ncbi:hypothetical protein BGX26_002940, partial [Mortierella sp. AD094]
MSVIEKEPLQEFRPVFKDGSSTISDQLSESVNIFARFDCETKNIKPLRISVYSGVVLDVVTRASTDQSNTDPLKSSTSKQRDLKRRRSTEANNENDTEDASARKRTHIQSHVSSKDTGLERNQSSIHSNGHSGPYSDIDALDLHTNATNKGDPIEQCALADIYQHGKGVPQDHFKAAKWYLRAANQGLAIAQYQLGSMNYHGKGIPRSYQKSLEWYLKAAEKREG